MCLNFCFSFTFCPLEHGKLAGVNLQTLIFFSFFNLFSPVVFLVIALPSFSFHSSIFFLIYRLDCSLNCH